MPALTFPLLTAEEEKALFGICSRGPSAAIDLHALASLVNAGMVHVNKVRRMVLTKLGRGYLDSKAPVSKAGHEQK